MPDILPDICLPLYIYIYIYSTARVYLNIRYAYHTRIIRVSNQYAYQIYTRIILIYTRIIRPRVCCHIYEHAFRTTDTNINGYGII